MSEELPPESPENRLSTADEVGALHDQFVKWNEGGVSRSNPYVAPPAPGHDVHGFWHTFGAAHRSGYATHAISLHWILDKIFGVPTQLIPHRNMDIDIDQFPKDRYEMLFDWHKQAVGYPHVAFSSFPPEVSWELAKLGPPIIPYIAFEGTTVSPVARDMMNAPDFRATWVVHEFVKQALVDSGVAEDRVHVAPPMLFGGPWEGMHSLGARPLSPITPDDPFVFGVLGTWHERKGFHDLLRAYFHTFRREDPVQLVIRTSAFGKQATIREFKEQLTEEISAIAQEFGDDGFPESRKQPKLKLLLGTDATDEEVIRWLGRDIDCYVSPSYGEGLGIPHIWAKGQGVPMINTGFGAVGQLLNDIQDAGGCEDSILPFSFVPVHHEMFKLALMFDRKTLWGSYDYRDLGDAMRLQYERGRRVDAVGADFVRQRHGEDNASAAVLEGLRKALGNDSLSRWDLGE